MSGEVNKLGSPVMPGEQIAPGTSIANLDRNYIVVFLFCRWMTSIWVAYFLLYEAVYDVDHNDTFFKIFRS